MVSLLLLKWLIFVLMATGIRGPVICRAPMVVRKLPVKYGRTKNNTKNGDKNVIKNTYLFKNVGIKNTNFWKTHFCFNGKHEIQNWQRWKIKIILLFNRNGECYWNEISFSINNEIYSINSFCFVLHFYISISNSFIQLNEQLISIMKWVLCCFIQRQNSFWLDWKWIKLMFWNLKWWIIRSSQNIIGKWNVNVKSFIMKQKWNINLENEEN